MSVVWHQTIGQDRHIAFAAKLGHETPIIPIVVIAEKNTLSPISSLRNMMGNSGYDDPRHSSHSSSLNR